MYTYIYIYPDVYMYIHMCMYRYLYIFMLIYIYTYMRHLLAVEAHPHNASARLFLDVDVVIGNRTTFHAFGNLGNGRVQNVIDGVVCNTLWVW